MNSLWLVITALAAFLVAYRFYGAFLAAKVAVLNDPRRHARPPAARRRRLPPHAAAGAVRRPFRRHRRLGAAGRARCWPRNGATFPASAGSSIGACLAGGVHDFVVLLASVRQDGLSLPKIARNLLGPGLRRRRPRVATLFIIVATLAGVGHGGGQRPERKPLGHVHDRRHDPRRAADRLLDEQDPARAASARPR